MQKRILTFLFSSVIYLFSFAESPDSADLKIYRQDTNYILDYRYHFQIKTLGLTRQAEFRLINTNEAHSIDFSTNNPFSFGLAIDYSWISLEYTKTIKGFEFTDERKGKSEAQAFRLGMTGRRYTANLYYRNTRGYNLENVEDWVPDWFEDHEKYPFAPGLESRILALSLYYTFNHKKYSNAAALRQNARQIKSAGSPVAGIQANVEGVFSPTPMLSSDTLARKFLNIAQVQYLKFGITGGYMHTFSIKKRFYLNAALVQGLLYSVGRGSYHDYEEIDDISAIGVSFYLRLGLGYNGKRWYSGLHFSGDIFANDVSSELYNTSAYSNFKIFVGYRFHFNRKPWMKKLYL